MTETITLPIRGRGRPTERGTVKYNNDLQNFCDAIIKIHSRLDFNVSSRGWCYLLEEYGLKKGDFDQAQRLINDCRKSGMLPLDICAEDEARKIEGIDDIDNSDVNNYASEWVDYLMNDVSAHYRPYPFTDYQDYYVEIFVEKIDLKGLFRPICNKYHIPYGNARGWSDINSRAAMMRRFRKWEEKGKQCVLLYCGDHDPGGLNISDTLRKNFEDLIDAVAWNPDNLIIDRFGLNYEFIEENNLTWIENLETGKDKNKGINDLSDPRHPDHFKDYVQTYLMEYGPRKVEANALVTRVDAGRRLCEKAILKYIDIDGMNKYNQDTINARQDLQQEIIKQMTE